MCTCICPHIMCILLVNYMHLHYTLLTISVTFPQCVYILKVSCLLLYLSSLTAYHRCILEVLSNALYVLNHVLGNYCLPPPSLISGNSYLQAVLKSCVITLLCDQPSEKFTYYSQ